MAIEDEDLTPAERLQEVLEEIADAVGVDTEVEVLTDPAGDNLSARFVGAEAASLIGDRGEILDAIQHVAYRVAFRGVESRGRVSVDAAGYREQRAQALREVAEQAAVSALRDGQPVALDPMSALERKVVHELLKDRDDVQTYSEGQEPSRRLVVAPVAA